MRRQYDQIQSINPLPTILHAFQPTTGYDDVKAVALARLAAPNVPSIQIDWLRYGPKLAQVALTFGADDLDNVTASDELPTGAGVRRSKSAARDRGSRLPADGARRPLSGHVVNPVRIGAVGYLNARPLTWA